MPSPIVRAYTCLGVADEDTNDHTSEGIAAVAKALPANADPAEVMIGKARRIVSQMPSQLNAKTAAEPSFKRPTQAKVRAQSKPKTAASGIKTTAKVPPKAKVVIGKVLRAVSKMPCQFQDKIASQPVFKRPAQAKVRASSKPKTDPSGLKTAGKVLSSVKKNGGASKVKYSYEHNQRVTGVTFDAGVLLSRIDAASFRVPADSVRPRGPAHVFYPDSVTLPDYQASFQSWA
jgi:hypothetical protein